MPWPTSTTRISWGAEGVDDCEFFQECEVSAGLGHPDFQGQDTPVHEAHLRHEVKTEDEKTSKFQDSSDTVDVLKMESVLLREELQTARQQAERIKTCAQGEIAVFRANRTESGSPPQLKNGSIEDRSCEAVQGHTVTRFSDSPDTTDKLKMETTLLKEEARTAWEQLEMIKISAQGEIAVLKATLDSERESMQRMRDEMDPVLKQVCEPVHVRSTNA